mmetsp:Transcript_30772/g.73850  ORF Transcript_30772/g.73850 Transcript_30772/m.73850 type:complete len:85 (+) Transcript_30772:28-282(+)
MYHLSCICICPYCTIRYDAEEVDEHNHTIKVLMGANEQEISYQLLKVNIFERGSCLRQSRYRLLPSTAAARSLPSPRPAQISLP